MRARILWTAFALLFLPVAAWAQTPAKACAERTDLVTRSCLIEAMAAEPGIAEGATCTEDRCWVELECNSWNPGTRYCTGSGYEAWLDWDEESGVDFDLFVTEPDGSESMYSVCGTCAGTELMLRCGTCERPQWISGRLSGLDLLVFPGGAMLEYAVGQAAEEVALLASAETFRIPEDVPAGFFNVRSGPGTIHEVLFTIPAGTGQIVQSGECRPPEPDGQGSDWCPIAWEGNTGWISTLGLEPEQS